MCCLSTGKFEESDTDGGSDDTGELIWIIIAASKTQQPVFNRSLIRSSPADRPSVPNREPLFGSVRHQNYQLQRLYLKDIFQPDAPESRVSSWLGCPFSLDKIQINPVVLLSPSDRTPAFGLRADARWCRSLRNPVWYHAFEFVTGAISTSVIPCASISALTAGGSVSSVSSTCGLIGTPSTLIATSLPR